MTNREAAQYVHGLIAKMAPAEARVFARMLALEGLDYDTATYGVELAQARLDRVGQLEQELVGRAISKAADGTEPEDEKQAWQALQLIRKDLSWTMTSEERRRQARLRHRDFRTKRFVRESRRVQFAPQVHLSPERAAALGVKPAVDAASAAGVPLTTLTDAQLQHYRQGYAQVAQLLEPYHNDDRALVELRYANGHTALHPVPKAGQVLPIDPSSPVVLAEVHVVPRSAGEVAARVGTALTDKGVGPTTTNMKTYADAAAYDQTDEFRPAGSALFRRTLAASNLLHNTGVATALGPQAQTAVLAGQYIGSLGPEAMRVVNPVVDRAAYRYRGTEIEGGLDPVLVNHVEATRSRVGPRDLGPHPDEQLAATRAAIDRSHAQAVREVDVRHKGATQVEPAWQDPDEKGLGEQDKRARHEHNRARAQVINDNKLIARGPLSAAEARASKKRLGDKRKELHARAKASHATELAAYNAKAAEDQSRVRSTRRTLAVHGSSLTHGVNQVTRSGEPWNQAEVLDYFRQKLPNARLSQLQLKSGHTAPSQGVILTADGQVAHQSVGYGDDWYVPFNLKQLDSLRGGEYIRTRTFGGLTPEDLYTGLAAGARAVTVVSHSGTFTVEFDDSLTGGRRYNDKTARMVQRYASLLDSVKSGQIALESTDPELEKEIEEGASLAASDAAGRRDAAERARKALLDAPRISTAKQAQESLAFLTELADKRGGTTRAPDKMGGTSSVPPMEQTVRDAANTLAAREVNEVRRSNEAEQARFDAESNTARAVAEHATQASGGRTRYEPGYVTPAIIQPLPDAEALAAQKLTELDPNDTADMAEVARRAHAVADALGAGAELDKHLTKVKAEVAQSMQPLRLNGRGYYTATSALKDQFPFAIKQEYWHPWIDGSEGRDTGYVRPNHNRPAQALVGYFDPSPFGGPKGSAGGSKVVADSIRGQEKDFKYAEEAAKPKAETKTEQAAGAATGASRSARASAAKAMAAHLHTLKFQAGGNLVNANGDAVSVPAGADPKVLARDPNSQSFPGELKAVLSQELPAINAALDGADQAKFDAMFNQIVAAAQFASRPENTALKLDPQLMKNLERGGMAAGPDDFADAIRSPETDRGFPNQPVFNATTAHELEVGYPNVKEIAALVKAGKLPARLPWSPEDRQKVEAHHEELKAGLAEYEDLEKWNPSAAKAMEAKLSADARGHVAARQLARKHEKLVNASAQRRQENEPEVRVVDPGTIDAFLQAAERARQRELGS